jgi:hypothetical protein
MDTEKAPMRRTTIMLPGELHGRVTRIARQLGVSLGEFVRQALRARLEGHEGPPGSEPFFADRVVFEGKAPRDAAAHHDLHLYGVEE